MKEGRRQFWVILIIVFLGFVGISMPYLIFPPLFLNPAYSFLPIDWSESNRALSLGITLAAYPLGQFVGSPILGALSDDYGRKQLLAGSLVVAAISNLLTGIAIQNQHLSLLIASRLIAGFMEGNIAIARALAADIKTISKQESFGKMNAVVSIAYLIGPFLGGLLTNKHLFEGLTTATPFFFICLLFFCLAGLSALVLQKSTLIPPAKMRTFWERINFVKRASALFANKQLKFLIIVSTVSSLAVDIFFEFGPVYLTVKWALGPAQLMLYNGALCVGLIVGSGWLPALLSSREPIFCAIGGFGLFLLGIVLTYSPALMIVLFGACGVAIGLVATLLTVKISDSVSDAIQGEVMGTQLSLRVLGDGVICLFGGALLILSSTLILTVAAGMSFAAMFYYRSRKN